MLLRFYSFKGTVILVISMFIIDFLYLSSRSISTIGDSYLIFMEGYGQGEFDLISFLFLLIINGIPLYIAALNLDEHAQRVSMHVMVRHKSKRRYFCLTQITYCIFLLGYFLLHLIFILIHGLLFRFDFGFGKYSILVLDILQQNPSSLKSILLMSLCLRFLELLSVQGIIALLQSLKISIAFICTILGYFVLLFIVFPYYPLGLSSILRWTTMGENIYVNFCLSSGIFMGMLFFIYFYMNKKGIYQLLEG